MYGGPSEGSVLIWLRSSVGNYIGLMGLLCDPDCVKSSVTPIHTLIALVCLHLSARDYD